MNTHVFRQSVSCQLGTCDVRIAHQLFDRIGNELRILVGRPKRVAVLSDNFLDEKSKELLERDLIDNGFDVVFIQNDKPFACDIVSAEVCFEKLAAASITSDDVLLALGSSQVFSLASWVSFSWQQTLTLAYVPSDMVSLLEAISTPRALDIANKSEVLNAPSHVSLALCDLDRCDFETPEVKQAVFAIMVSTCVAYGQEAFGELVDAADALKEGDVDTWAGQVLSALRMRGRIAQDMSPAVRQAIYYGSVLRHAFQDVVPGLSCALAQSEALRFLSRLSCATGECSVDFVLMQDEALDMFGLHEISCAVDPDILFEAIRRERFSFSNKFMLQLPQDFGRVRLSVIDPDVLLEHCQAWCQARSNNCE